jgi:hypothetical protein
MDKITLMINYAVNIFVFEFLNIKFYAVLYYKVDIHIIFLEKKNGNSSSGLGSNFIFILFLNKAYKSLFVYFDFLDG